MVRILAHLATPAGIISSAPRGWALIAILIGLLVTPAAQAQQAATGSLTWSVIEATGDVRVRMGDGAKTAAAKPGDTLAGNQQIETGAGRAVLVHQGSRITIAANSRITLPANVPAGAVYRVVQQIGTALYSIVHASKDKFEVETPYLTTAIKGTVFSVSVNGGGGSVHVTEGAVFVRPLSGVGATIMPGQTARVAAGARSEVIINRGGGGRTNGAPPSGNDGSDQRGSIAPDRNSAPATETAGAPPGRRAVAIVFEDLQTAGRSGKLGASAPDNSQGPQGSAGTPSDTARSASDNAGGNGNGNAGNTNSGNAGGGNGNAGGHSGGPAVASSANSNAGGNGGGNVGGQAGAGLMGNASGNGGGNGNGGGAMAAPAAVAAVSAPASAASAVLSGTVSVGGPSNSGGNGLGASNGNGNGLGGSSAGLGGGGNSVLGSSNGSGNGALAAAGGGALGSPGNGALGHSNGNGALGGGGGVVTSGTGTAGGALGSTSGGSVLGNTGSGNGALGGSSNGNGNGNGNAGGKKK